MSGRWKGRRVLVTGHTGFKGAWLALWLRKMGAEVYGIALESEKPSLFESVGLGREIRSIIADVRDARLLKRHIGRAAPEVIFHLAAQSLVRRSYADPIGTYDTNVLGTANVLDSARTAGSVRAVLIATSDKCYENIGLTRGYREDEALGGADPYSSSKACAELVTAAYRRSFFSGRGAAAVASARAGNVIGGGDWSEDRLVPDFARAAAARRPLLVRNPKSVRPWQHVLDCLAGYLKLSEKLLSGGAAYAEAWNFGPLPRERRDVRRIADGLVARWGPPASWRLDRGSHPHEEVLLTVDASKARARLGWKPKLSLDATLDWTVEWYRAAAARADLRAVTFSQLERYEAL